MIPIYNLFRLFSLLCWSHRRLVYLHLRQEGPREPEFSGRRLPFQQPLISHWLMACTHAHAHTRTQTSIMALRALCCIHSFTSSPHLRPPQRSCENEGCRDAPPSPTEEKEKKKKRKEWHPQWTRIQMIIRKDTASIAMRSVRRQRQERARPVEFRRGGKVQGGKYWDFICLGIIRNAFISISNGLDWLIGQEWNNGNGYKTRVRPHGASVGKTRLVFR